MASIRSYDMYFIELTADLKPTSYLELLKCIKNTDNNYDLNFYHQHDYDLQYINNYLKTIYKNVKHTIIELFDNKIIEKNISNPELFYKKFTYV